MSNPGNTGGRLCVLVVIQVGMCVVWVLIQVEITDMSGKCIVTGLVCL